MTDQNQGVIPLIADNEIPLPRTNAFIVQLRGEYGEEYVKLLTLAVACASHRDQAMYRKGLDAATDALVGPYRAWPSAWELAKGHMGVILTELGADTRTASHGGARPPRSRRRV